MSEYPVAARARGHRHTERLSYDAAVVHEILDSALICHVGLDSDGPLVLPMIHARVGEQMYLHVSTGSGTAFAAPTPVCITATIVDGLVLAKSQFHHSMNYRSVVVRGVAEPVGDPAEREMALAAIVDHVVPGRSRSSRAGNARELAATRVLRVDLEEVSAKVRTGPATDEPEDAGLPYWAGVIPIALRAGTPEPDPTTDPGLPPPDLSRLGS